MEDKKKHSMVGPFLDHSSEARKEDTLEKEKSREPNITHKEKKEDRRSLSGEKKRTVIRKKVKTRADAQGLH